MNETSNSTSSGPGSWCRKEAGHVLLHDPADVTPPLPGSPGIPGTATTPGTPTGAGATTAQCHGVREVEAESVAYLVAAAHRLPTDDYTFAYVTGWAAGVDRAEPRSLVRRSREADANR
jgi:hypothetical protein